MSKLHQIDEYYNLTRYSHFVDIGSGFGRWIITAVCLTGCSATGIEIVQKRTERAQLVVDKYLPSWAKSRIQFVTQNAGQYDFEKVTHLVSYNQYMSDSDMQDIATQLNQASWRVIVWSYDAQRTANTGLQNYKLMSKERATNTGGEGITLYVYINTGMQSQMAVDLPYEEETCKHLERARTDFAKPQSKGFDQQSSTSAHTAPQLSLPSMPASITSATGYAIYVEMTKQVLTLGRMFGVADTEALDKAQLQAQINDLRSEVQRLSSQLSTSSHNQPISKTPHVKFKQTLAPQGIQNLGNTCWAGSCYQVVNGMLATLGTQTLSLPSTLQELKEYYTRIFITSPIETSAVYDFKPRLEQQQDMSEAFGYLLDTHYKMLGEQTKFTERQTIRCLLCGNESISEQENTLCTLTLKANFNDSLADHMSESLEEYLCGACQQKCGAQLTREFVVNGLFFVTVLKRFKHTEIGFTKIDTPIECEDVIEINQIKYNLLSFVIHKGAIGKSYGGHYIAYIKLQNQWYQCDDSVVVQVDDITNELRQAYVLVYTQLTKDALSMMESEAQFEAQRTAVQRAVLTERIMPQTVLETGSMNLIGYFAAEKAKKHISRVENMYSKALEDTYKGTPFTKVRTAFCDGFAVTTTILPLKTFKDHLMSKGIQVYSGKRTWHGKEGQVRAAGKTFIRLDDNAAWINKDLCASLSEAMNSYRQLVSETLSKQGKEDTSNSIYIMKFDDTQDLEGCLYAQSWQTAIKELQALFVYRKAIGYKSSASCLQFMKDPTHDYPFKIRHKFYCKDIHLLQTVSSQKKISQGMNVLLNCSAAMLNKFEVTKNSCLSRSERSTQLHSVEQEQEFLKDYLVQHSQVFHDQAVQLLNQVENLNCSVNRQCLWNIDQDATTQTVFLQTQKHFAIVKAYSYVRLQFVGIVDVLTPKKNPHDLIKKYSLPGKPCHVYKIQDKQNYEHTVYYKKQDEPYQIWVSPLGRNVGTLEERLNAIGVSMPLMRGSLVAKDVNITLQTTSRIGNLTAFDELQHQSIVKRYESHKGNRQQYGSIDALCQGLHADMSDINLVTHANGKLIFFAYESNNRYVLKISTEYARAFEGVLTSTYPTVYKKPQKATNQAYLVYSSGLNAGQLRSVIENTAFRSEAFELHSSIMSIASEAKQQNVDQVLGKRPSKNRSPSTHSTTTKRSTRQRNNPVYTEPSENTPNPIV